MATDLGVLEYLEAEQRREKLLAKVADEAYLEPFQ